MMRNNDSKVSREFFYDYYYYYLKRDDKLVNFYDVEWLLYQRIFNTFMSLPYPCSRAYYVVQYIILIFSHAIFMFKTIQ